MFRFNPLTKQDMVSLRLNRVNPNGQHQQTGQSTCKNTFPDTMFLTRKVLVSEQIPDSSVTTIKAYFLPFQSLKISAYIAHLLVLVPSYFPLSLTECSLFFSSTFGSNPQ